MAKELQRQDTGAAATQDADDFAALLKQSFRPRNERAATEVEKSVATLVEQALADATLIKEDVLDTLDEIPVCVGYEYEGKPMEEMPPQAEALARVRPIYRNFPGWKQSTFGLTQYADLPPQARAYLEFIRDQLGIEIAVISTGPEREQSIVLAGTRLEQLLPRPFSHS